MTVPDLTSWGGFNGNDLFILRGDWPVVGINFGINATLDAELVLLVLSMKFEVLLIVAGWSLGIFFLIRLLFIPDAFAKIELFAADVNIAVLKFWAGALYKGGGDIRFFKPDFWLVFIPEVKLGFLTFPFANFGSTGFENFKVANFDSFSSSS